jgi:hypothetical protein
VYPAGVSTVQIELMAIEHILRHWKDHPSTPLAQFPGISWHMSPSEALQPLSDDRVSSMKRYLKQHAPSHYASLFPDGI